MTRWNETLKLVSVEKVQDDSGAFVDERSERAVFCNPMTMGTTAWTAARAGGLKADVEVQVRSADYNGEQRAVFRGVECEVERAQDSGEFTALTMAKRANGGRE